MPSFSDSLFLFVLALLLFGPKRLPVLARELGKWIGEFRRASNEFKLQMEDELRQSEQAERQKQIAAMEAAAPVPPPIIPEPEHPHMPSYVADAETASTEFPVETMAAVTAGPVNESPVPAPLPIATSGSLNIMPPGTGLPVARARAPIGNTNPLSGLLHSIPGELKPDIEPVAETHTPLEHAQQEQETAAHG